MPWIVCDVCRGAKKVKRQVRRDTTDKNGNKVTITETVTEDCKECGGDGGWNRNM